MVSITMQNRVWLCERVRETTFWYIDLGAVYLATCLILLSISFLLAITHLYSLNAIDKTAIVTRYFAILPGVTKWHVVLFEGALLIKITTISMLFVFEWYCTEVLIEDAVLIKKIWYIIETSYLKFIIKIFSIDSLCSKWNHNNWYHI